MGALLRPWLGDAGLDRDLPIPAMIDATLDEGGLARVDAIAASVARAAPGARVERHAAWLAPLIGVVRSLGLLAGGIVALMAAATAAAVVLAARSALDTHSGTIEVMHMMGATDVQIARLFQRRLALDALYGALVGLAAAVAVMLSIGRRIAAVGSGLIGSAGLSAGDWLLVLLLPFAAAAVAFVVARLTVVAAMRRAL